MRLIRPFAARHFIAGGFLIAVSLVAFAKLVGPFLMASVATYAGMTYAQDQAGLFSAAVNLPRAIMGVSVGNIRKGDIVRIVYPDGSVYDFEAERGCAFTLSRACEYSKATQVSSADAPTTPSEWQMEFARQKVSCSITAGTYTTVSTPFTRWSSVSDWNQATQTMTTTGYTTTTWYTFGYYVPSGRPVCQ